MKIALVVPCTKSKSRLPSEVMRFGALAKGECAQVALRWQAAAQSQSFSIDAVRASELYSGNNWNLAARAQAELGDECQLWIVSAGFGLVSSDECLPAYSATFAAEENRVSDQISGERSPAAAHAAWWKSINAERRRTETPLLTTFAEFDRVILALSAPYLAAVREDALALARELGPQKLWMVAMETRALPLDLRECAVFENSEVENLIGGTRVTLNLRALEWWLREVVPVTGWDRAAQQLEIRRRICQATPAPTRPINPMSDAEVTTWIEARRAEAGGQWPSGGKTGLLRTLRVGGRSCEQKRFSRLCERVLARGEAEKLAAGGAS